MANPTKTNDFALREGMRVHIIGIGGSGMSAIAHVLLGRGHVVTGSDMQENELTTELRRAGAQVYRGHAARHVAGAEVVVVSSAVPATNAEIVAARRAGIPVLKRAEFIGALMRNGGGIAVAGSHGKTTTTGLIAHILLATGRDPSVIAGGVLPSLGSNGRAGDGAWFVVEADEYDYMFLGLRPSVAVITNVEHDHPDMFPTAAAYQEAFTRFAALLPADGLLVACADDAGVQALLPAMTSSGVRLLAYGLDTDGPVVPDLRATDVRPNQLGGSDFLVESDGETLGIARLRLPGRHNVQNALAAIGVALHVGVPLAEMVPALASFGGVSRRFQVIGEARGVTLVDDYAHHPTEIQVTLAAARQRYAGRRLWAVWQPHTFSRTRLYRDAFAASFHEADAVIVMDIYRSREQDPQGISAAEVVARMDHPQARYLGPREEAAAFLLEQCAPGDVILTLGAGDGNAVGEWVLDGLREQANRSP